MWSYILAFIGLTGTYLISRKIWWGWIVSWVNNLGWMIYGYYTNQGGMVLSGVIYMIIQTAAIIKWRKEQDSNLRGY